MTFQPFYMSAAVKIKVNPRLFLRDPQESKLGKRMIQHGIELIDEIGIEKFTFKKLAIIMDSTEASIYRYFENKHFFLVYLVSWYWEWVNFRIEFNSMNIEDPKRKLRITIKTIVDTIRLANPVEYIDRDLLHRIVVKEGIKSYHINQVEEEDKLGFFSAYKELNQKITTIIKAVNPKFLYPKTLASNILEMANNQTYLAEHLPSLTDIKIKKGNMQPLVDMLDFFVFNIIDKKK